MKVKSGFGSCFVAAAFAIVAFAAGEAAAQGVTCAVAETVYGVDTPALLAAMPECARSHTANAPSTSVTTIEVQQATVALQTAIIQDQIRIAQGVGLTNPLNQQVSMRPGKAGISAGNWMRGINVWGSLAWTQVEDTTPVRAFDGTVIAGAMGADFEVRSGMVVGGALVIEQTNIDTTFNSGTQDTLGISGAAYMAYDMRPFSFEAIAGYGYLDHDLERSDMGAAVTGSTTGSRFYGQVRANYFHEYGKVKLNPYVGVLYSHETVDGFTESNGMVRPDAAFEIGQAHIGGEIAYAAGWASPFIRLRYEYDFARDDTPVGPLQTQPAKDRDGLVLGAGYYIDLGPDMRAIAEASTTLLRDNYTEYTLRARLKIRF